MVCIQWSLNNEKSNVEGEQNTFSLKSGNYLTLTTGGATGEPTKDYSWCIALPL